MGQAYTVSLNSDLVGLEGEHFFIIAVNIFNSLCSGIGVAAASHKMYLILFDMLFLGKQNCGI